MDMSAGAASLCSALLLVSLLLFVSAEQKTISADPGQNVTLTCRAPSNNTIIVEWSRADLGSEYVLLYQDGQFVPDNQHPSFKKRVDLQDRQMKDGDVSVILKDVTVNDEGTYECRVYMRERLRLISIIYLRVHPPGQTRGLTLREDGGEEDAGKEDAGKEDGSAGLLIGPLVFLIVSAVLVVVSCAVTVVVGVCVGVVVMCRGGTSRGSYRFTNQ
ncbi:uncharacterized protein LOC115776577 [Archocentrus centrarchus]|uniref:uncharacterized protein LOC115776577 n=1 Tax=Archocentrus centrarchus TaxID=63155 RepID=UPI0011EA163C|nr:uncharacterized protein LOC115776577 [Archocentrus centrarchus]